MDVYILVETYLDVAAKCGIATREQDWAAKKVYSIQLWQLELIMKEHCVSLDERENPIIPTYNAINGTDMIYFFHVRIEDKPWKMVDVRGNIWSDWT